MNYITSIKNRKQSMQKGSLDYFFDEARHSLLEMLPKKINKVLDVGCSVGVNGMWLRENKGANEVVGIELLHKAARKAEAVLNKVIVGDVENINIEYPKGYFDCIIYSDVLEHLRDPWSLMACQRKFLAEDGYVLVSMPNISNWRIVADLLRDKWEYKNSGILDRTHLRFFTRRSMQIMFDQAGYQTEKVAFNRGRYSKIVSYLTSGYLNFLFTFQYYFLLRKSKSTE